PHHRRAANHLPRFTNRPWDLAADFPRTASVQPRRPAVLTEQLVKPAGRAAVGCNASLAYAMSFARSGAYSDGYFSRRFSKRSTSALSDGMISIYFRSSSDSWRPRSLCFSKIFLARDSMEVRRSGSRLPHVTVPW